MDLVKVILVHSYMDGLNFDLGPHQEVHQPHGIAGRPADAHLRLQRGPSQRTSDESDRVAEYAGGWRMGFVRNYVQNLAGLVRRHASRSGR